MRVFVIGATGFVGTAIVQELISAGHQVLGLARSDALAQKLIDLGAEVHRGELEDLDSLRSGAALADGVIHAGFIHDFTRFVEVCKVDKTAIETIGEVLAGSGRPFIVTSGTALVNPGKLATEDIKPPINPAWPRSSEQTGDSVNASAIRLSPSVHGDDDKHGFIPILVNIAKEKGVSTPVRSALRCSPNCFNSALVRYSVKLHFHLCASNSLPISANSLK
jgi:nucleoside-diphosphate-sugar epimerase